LAKPHKQATFNQHVAALKKAVVVENPDEYLDQKPTWRLGLLELCPPFGWHEATLAHVDDVRQRLGALESMTWREILFADNGKSNHLMPLDKLAASVQERMIDVAPDVDELMSLRVAKKRRVYGIMHGAVCQILFWDPEHLVYEMNVADN
jgi:hypothetical protein